MVAQSCEKAREVRNVVPGNVYFHGVFGFDMAARSGLREMEGEALRERVVRAESVQCRFEIAMVRV